ncbi:MAG: chloride channel protein, partial [Ignavibacteriae bacterium]|nr:chloride channel protein [Ignavibacteriota bacterium]MCB0752021.1 chloride channel protein [Ignavibacteriota bacterium]
MIIVAIIIGVLAGFAAIGIRALIEGISLLSFPGTGSILENIISTPWYLIIIIPAIGGLIVGPLIYFFAPEAKGHGVPEVMQAILLRGGTIRPRVAFVKAIASAITIGTGGSVGREGPIIQIGSSLGSSVGQFFKLPSSRLKTLVGCGAAAGIAAAFNAPIAGALFAVEIILMDFAVAQFSPIVISSVLATVVS